MFVKSRSGHQHQQGEGASNSSVPSSILFSEDVLKMRTLIEYSVYKQPSRDRLPPVNRDVAQLLLGGCLRPIPFDESKARFVFPVPGATYMSEVLDRFTRSSTAAAAARTDKQLLKVVLAAELALFVDFPIQGVYVFPLRENWQTWVCFFRPHGGYFHGDLLRLFMEIPDVYPARAPACRFNPAPALPFVDGTTGSLDVNGLLGGWDGNKNNILQIVATIRRDLLIPNLDRVDVELPSLTAESKAIHAHYEREVEGITDDAIPLNGYTFKEFRIPTTDDDPARVKECSHKLRKLITFCREHGEARRVNPLFLIDEALRTLLLPKEGPTSS